MERVVVVGAAGSGKTTLARAASARLQIPFVDVDDLFWCPGWECVDIPTLRGRLGEQTRGDRWVVAGNYTTHVRDLLWSRADTLVWLDLPRATSFRRVVLRTVRDVVQRRELWPGCRQSPLAPFRTRLLQRAWVQPARYRVKYEQFLAEPSSAHLEVVRLRTTAAVAEWLHALTASE
jgi:adenylate kinase family enzyme